MRQKILILVVIILSGMSLTGLIAQTVTDIDGNVYKTVIIAKRVLMAENLRSTRYNNGDSIGTTIPASLDISDYPLPAYQWAYEGNEKNVSAYGRLYTWGAITDKRKVCPAGWHIPSNEEWKTIADGYGGKHKILRKFKSIFGWKDPAAGTISESEFSGLPSGGRNYNGEFEFLGIYGNWWSSTMFDDLNTGRLHKRGYIYGGLADLSYLKNYACSVRCIMDK